MPQKTYLMDEFLDEIDQEEANAGDELGQRVIGPHRQDFLGEGVREILPRLRQHVGEDGGQKDSSAEAKEATDDPLSLLASLVDVLLHTEREETEEEGQDAHESEGDDLRREELHLVGVGGRVKGWDGRVGEGRVSGE